jgi:hypothetical protein
MSVALKYSSHCSVTEYVGSSCNAGYAKKSLNIELPSMLAQAVMSVSSDIPITVLRSKLPQTIRLPTSVREVPRSIPDKNTYYPERHIVFCLSLSLHILGQYVK